MSNGRAMDALGVRGWLTEDVDCTFCGVETKIEERKYQIQVSGEINASTYWTEYTTMSPQKYLREIAPKHPDAMILRTKYR